jgi:PKD repeat protein
LTASNSAGSTTANKTVSVAAVKPVAAFSYSPTTLKHGATIKFTDTSSNIPTKWQWTFSDTTTKPTTNITSHVFSKAGTYTVTLYVYNSAGSNSIKKTLKVS